MIRSLLFLGCSLFVSPPQKAAHQRTFAVVVGVSDYKFGLPGKGDLEYSDDDANKFTELLRSRAGGNVPFNNIKLLTDRKASRANILQAMTIFKNATSNDRIIFFFSGHGDKGVFLPYDAEPGNVLLHEDIKTAFRESVAGTKLLLADACMSGSMGKRVYAQPLHPVDSMAVQSTINTHTSNVVVMLSSRSNQESQESSRLKQGAYTYYLIKGARGAADTMPSDGIVTIKELHYYVWRKLREVIGGGHRSEVFGNFPENLSFTSVNP